MSYCRAEGKDKIIFATAEEHAKESTVKLPEPEERPGLILPDGEINWNCPCLGGMATGPCGVEFREAFSCFHHSQAEPKGSDCYDAFSKMQECMVQYPEIYDKRSERGEDDEEEDPMAALAAESAKKDDKGSEESNKEAKKE
ncbi:mitochondrial intermembrane space import and assembly protein 40-B [Neocloeon triangulifer]|uniref:mitochondrial intermembrane space import and assembly protein 40-B n=1 Tax=Neocloeon triangulifer TaxID=2078957 RepID=UPI00286EBA8C|nr:mitochondrial intermembrane space import and assembly protein 40-B [Neocloeon triangulifer]XP_059481175.1 mitochondrial intermembrane space import and assembly protein 40-B [Neocloeon triangulifer]